MGTRTWKCFFLWPTGFAYRVWIINKVRVQYPQAPFLDLLLMDSINLLMFEGNFFLLLISTFNPHEIIFWNSVHQWAEQKAFLIGQQNFNLSGDVRFQWIQRSTIRCIAACSIRTDLYILRQNFQTSRSSSALKLKITFLKANVLFLNEKYFWKRRKFFIIKMQNTRHMDLKLLLIRSKEWLNYSYK